MHTARVIAEKRSKTTIVRRRKTAVASVRGRRFTIAVINHTEFFRSQRPAIEIELDFVGSWYKCPPTRVPETRRKGHTFQVWADLFLVFHRSQELTIWCTKAAFQPMIGGFKRVKSVAKLGFPGDKTDL